MRRFSLRSITIAALVIVSMLAGAGVAVASHQFGDVPNSNPFHDQIDFLAERGVTLGCGGGNFCPNANVTRQEMAAFLERSARALSPVVLASTETVPSLTGNICETETHTAPFDQIAVLDASAYVFDSNAAGRVKAKPTVSVDGGSYFPVSDTFFMTESVADGESASTNSTGHYNLQAGRTYQFAVGSLTGTAAAETGCQLIVTISHRMSN